VLNYKLLSLDNEYLTIIKPAGKSLTIKPGENIKAQVVDILPDGGVLLRVKGQLLEVQSEIPLEKGTQLNLKILELSDKNIIKFQILSKLVSANIENINTLIDKLTLKKSGNILLNLNPEFKSILIENIFSFSNTSKFESILKNSGIFFENKLKKGLNYNDDIKFKLLKLLSSEETSASDKEKIKEIIKNIEQYQYISKLTDTIWTFIPLIEKDIQHFEFIYKKKQRKTLPVHFLLIRLEFRNLGSVDVNINLFNKNLFVNFFIENEKFLGILKEQVNELNKELNTMFTTSITFVNKKIDVKELVSKNFENLLDLKV
jgi:hypothetical protein